MPHSHASHYPRTLLALRPSLRRLHCGYRHPTDKFCCCNSYFCCLFWFVSLRVGLKLAIHMLFGKKPIFATLRSGRWRCTLQNQRLFAWSTQTWVNIYTSNGPKIVFGAFLLLTLKPQVLCISLYTTMLTTSRSKKNYNDRGLLKQHSGKTSYTSYTYKQA